MISTAAVLKSRLIDELAQRVRTKLGDRAAASGEYFLRQFYDPVSPDDMLNSSQDDLLGAALSLWSYTRSRNPDELKIRVYNPRLEEHGWQSRHTVIEIVNRDMPFLVDSVTNELVRRQLNVHLIIHPVVNVMRNSEGCLELVQQSETNDSQAESWMHLEIDQVADAGALDGIHQGLTDVLGDVRAAVEDWKPMRQRLRDIRQGIDARSLPCPAEEVEETRAFLEWVDDNFFTYLGYRDYKLVREGDRDYVVPVPDSGLGVLRKILPAAIKRSKTPLSPEVSQYAHEPNLLLVSKAQSKATVHRGVHMDYIGIKCFGKKREVTGEHRFLGLFTSSAYNQSVRRIPLLREKARRTVLRSGLSPTSHDGKALVHILETFPRDELFQIDEEELFHTAMGILQLQERQRLALFVRKDHFENFISAQVYVPKDRYDTSLRKRIQEILERSFNGTIRATHSHLDDSPLARWHFVVKTRPGDLPDYNVKQIEAHLAEIARSWPERLREVLVRQHREQKGIELLRLYQEAFNTAYQESFSIDVVLQDIDYLERLRTTEQLGLNLYRPVEMGSHQVKFKIYHAGDIPLSKILPILEDMGLNVITEIPYRVRPEGGDEALYIRDFGLESGDGAEIEMAQVRSSFQQTFGRVWRNEAESDQLNALVVRAGLSADEVVMLRACTKYLLQAGVTFSQEYMSETLLNNPGLTRLLVSLFRTSFDPDADEGRNQRVEEIRSRIRQELEKVRSLDQYRILWRYKNLIRSTLRTNYFQLDEQGNPKSCLSLKLDSRKILDLPEPRPLFEIFVHSPHFEAVHLRGGKVARGGIRWSDRREDFRTEILGLIKAQMVKNAVIVPVGAKGGFVVKNPAPDREARKKQGVQCYKTMIRGLLDLTDNLKDGQVVPPPRVVRRDDDDPYLVVAADKGTATFSDIANQVSQEYSFWMGDAFASGGSAGYDHKKMGITARGAFVSVQRHFREMAIDILKQDITVIGVGDMSGDVFGNGLLQSKHFKLLGAFNHLHIFVDPDPDPAASFRERRRLFEDPSLLWTDYDPDLISPGGGVFDRTSRSIDISPEMKAALDIQADQLTPSELIQAMLRAQVDLIWFGGIGTFVKSSRERHFEADDKANDSVRVDASELRCKVIGEGANLGLTQRGRIEYALGGGRLNTDAIDNSGGVDASDHEVNIKLLLGHVIANGDMTIKQRDTLMSKMTDEVGDLVLRDNYLQTEAISVAEFHAFHRLDRQRQLIDYLEKKDKLDRELEFLPDDEELDRREASRKCLTRPEIAILLAYSKIDLNSELLQSDLPDDPRLAEDLALYFPTPLRKKYRKDIEQHRLRREIIATYATNSMVNRVGPSFVVYMKQSTGMSVSDIARAYLITRDAFGLRSIWEAIEKLDYKVPSQLQIKLYVTIGDLVEHSTRWFLHHRPLPLDIARNLELFGAGIGILARSLGKILSKGSLKAFQKRVKDYRSQGVPAQLAQRLSSTRLMVSALDIVRLARALQADVEDVGRVYFSLGNRFNLDWLRSKAVGLGGISRWEKAATTAIVDEIFEQQADLTQCILTSGDRNVNAWLKSRPGLADRADSILKEMRKAPSAIDLHMLTVASHQLRLLVTE